MSKPTIEIRGFVLVLRHIVMISPVFEADDEEGSQFNVRMNGVRVPFKFPTRHDATLQREMLVKALNEALKADSTMPDASAPG